MNDRDSLPDPGTRVQYEEVPDPLSGKGPMEDKGTIVKTEVETTWLNVDEKVESEVARIELDSGGKKALNPDQIGAKIGEGETGRVAHVIGGGDTAGGGFFTPPPTQPTDIGREPDGEFDRPDTKDDVRPAPINRDTETGRFGIDPFDLTSGGIGESTDLFDSDRR